MIRNNWKYKLLALAVSLILWLYVNSERNPQSVKTYTIPVRTVDVARGYVAELDNPKISVSIRGLKAVVDTLAREDVEAQVDLDGLKPGRKVVEAAMPVLVKLPRAMEKDLSVESTPKAVRVRLEALEERKMPVEVTYTSDPPPGYSYSNPVLYPETVSVSGKASQLAKIRTTVISVSGDATGAATDDYYDVTPVDAAGNGVADVSVRPVRVRAKLEVIEVPSTKSVLVTPTFSGQPKFPFKVARYTVMPSSVTLEGKPSALTGLSTVATDRIGLEGADQTITRDVNLRVPPGVKAAGSKTVRVTIYIGSD